MLNSYRKNDPVIYIYQNNDSKTVEISALNPAAEVMTGYDSAELLGKPLSLLLPKRLNDTIGDIVEYKTGHLDIADALLKCREFSITNKKSHDVPCKMRVVRCAPLDNHEWFQIVLVTQDEIRHQAAFREVLAQNFKGHEVIDERSGLPDRSSLIKDLELTLFHTGNHNLSASFALISVDKFAQYRQDFGDEIAFGLFHHVIGICRRTLRADDTIGMVNGNSIGCILIDTNKESARMACNRLRWTIAASPMVLPTGLQIAATASITYTEIAEVTIAAELLDICESRMDALRADPLASNALSMAVASDRRTSAEDRRQRQIRMGPNRRKGQRRRNT